MSEDRAKRRLTIDGWRIPLAPSMALELPELHCAGPRLAGLPQE